MITNVTGYQHKKLSQIRDKHVLKRNGDETFEKYMIYRIRSRSWIYFIWVIDHDVYLDSSLITQSGKMSQN